MNKIGAGCCASFISYKKNTKKENNNEYKDQLDRTKRVWNTTA